jgi:predicted nucleic-acid-binding protein
VIGVDTNVLVRFIMQDEPVQARLATRFFAALSPSAPGHVSSVVLAELSWVLTRTYGASRTEVSSALEILLGSSSIVVEHVSCVDRALKVFRGGGADFSDALIAEIDREAGCTETVTFDKDAAKQAGMRLLS